MSNDVRESRLRRQLHRQGFALSKGRGRFRGVGFMITNLSGVIIAGGATGEAAFSLSVDDVEAFLAGLVADDLHGDLLRST